MKFPIKSNKGQVTAGLMGLLIALMVTLIVASYFYTTTKDVLQNASGGSLYTGNWQVALDFVPIILVIAAIGVLAMIGFAIGRAGGAR